MGVKEIQAQITILARYEDEIQIKVNDKTSGITFLDITLTREQFVNAAMNRLGNCEVKKAEVRFLDLVGKKMEMRNFEFPITVSGYDYKKAATEQIEDYCPKEWEPDMYFSSRDSFFEKNGIKYARTIIRRWV